MRFSLPVAVRLIAHMDPRDDGCIRWIGKCTPGGQPVLKIGGRWCAVRPLVQAWILPWRQPRARCHTRGCLNTSHKPGKVIVYPLATSA